MASSGDLWQATHSKACLGLSYKATEDTVWQEIDRDLIAASTEGVLLQGRHSYRT